MQIKKNWTHAHFCLCLFVFVMISASITESSPRRERKLKLEETSRSCVRSNSWKRTWRVTWTGSLRLKILILTTRTRQRKGANETVSNHPLLPLSHKKPTLLNFGWLRKIFSSIHFLVGLKAFGLHLLAHFVVTILTCCTTAYTQIKHFKHINWNEKDK